MQWDPPPPEERNGDITGYTVSIQLTAENQTTQIFVESEELTVSNLKPYTAYQVSVSAHTSAGQGPFSIATTVLTPEDGK